MAEPVTVGCDAAPARRCAFAVVRRVFEGGAYADRALHDEAEGLNARDRSLAMRLAYGTVQRRGTLDYLVTGLCERRVEKLDPPVLAALRLGLYQLHFTDGIADHAAVNESVVLARSAGSGRAAGLVNAVLRRAIRDGPALLQGLDDRTAEGAAVFHSLPVWLAQRWFAEMGANEARALMARCNEPAESAIRVNTLVCAPEDLVSRLPVGARADPTIPEALVLDGPFDAHGSALWREGALMPQSRGSMLVALAVAVARGDRVLDLCAAPGAKTTHLAARMGRSGSITAVERHRGRSHALQRTCLRMRADNVTVEVWDATRPRPGAETFDRVLVDPPCSGLGTLQSRPDLRWRVSPQSIEQLAAEQSSILDVAAMAVAPGGRLVYSTCTLSALENELQIEAFLARHPGFSPAPPGSDLAAWEHPSAPGLLLALPHRHHTDGFFIACLQRSTIATAGEDALASVRNGRRAQGL